MIPPSVLLRAPLCLMYSKTYRTLLQRLAARHELCRVARHELCRVVYVFTVIVRRHRHRSLPSAFLLHFSALNLSLSFTRKGSALHLVQMPIIYLGGRWLAEDRDCFWKNY